MISTQISPKRILLDSRDYPFLSLTAASSLLFIPAAIYFFTHPHFHSALAAIYLALIFLVYLGPFTLMLHNLCHRPAFQPRYKWIKHYVFWILGPIFGQTPETFYAYHIGMHHPENNLKNDLSSTLSYQRDSLVDFSKYLGRFLAMGTLELGIYLYKRRRFKLFRHILYGELAFYSIATGTLFLNLRASVVVFWIPMVVVRIAMMLGNWTQHAFIDSETPQHVYRNSITCIESVYNRRCFNDGHHIGHHLKMNLHWTEMPEDFEANREIYREEKAIVFRKLDYFMIWTLLMTRRFGRLAQYFVDLEPVKRDRQEIIELLKSRLKPIQCQS